MILTQFSKINCKEEEQDEETFKSHVANLIEEKEKEVDSLQY